MVSLRIMLQNKKLSLLNWLRRVFGMKTEKKSESKSTRKNTHTTTTGKQGRNGRNDYPGAKKVHVEHPDLKAGNDCPECHKGKLHEDEPGVDYSWEGNAPLIVTVYLLQRLLCNNCKTSFTAPSPVADSAKTVDDSQDKEKVTRCNRNAKANSVVACLHYMFGIPFYRLAKIQGSMGMGIPASTQYLMVRKVYEVAIYIYLEMMRQAANQQIILADDTWIKILDWMAGKGPPNKTDGKSLKQAKTSTIVAKSGDGLDIVLYLTDEFEAGHHVDLILEKRSSESGVPIYKCDGLSGNKLNGSQMVIATFCLDHARRKFIDIESAFPKESHYVVEELKLVYKADKEAKELGLNDVERMKYHQKHSTEPMKRLGEWMQDQIKSKKAEANGPLATAINYSLKRWSELNEFLTTPGVPLSNAECERAIKSIITYRKNSLFYKNEKGAHVGAVLQSLMSTCEKNGINCFEYLAWIQENKSKVMERPEEYLPWCFSG